MNLVLMGPPGAGKGTQGEILSKRLDINTISTGVMLRTAIKEQSEIGKMAEKATVSIVLEVKNQEELTNVINKLGQIQGVYQVKRASG